LTVLRNTLFVIFAALTVAFITLLLELILKKKTVYYSSNAPANSPESVDSFESIDSSVSIDTGEEQPTGLYTPGGNIGWESYTHDRLASELHRCASFEQDLTFLITELSKTESGFLYHQFTKEAVNYFGLRDLIFEKGERGISIIIPNANLEECIRKAGEFRSRSLAKLPDSFKGRDALCIGLSSRSGRLIEAERLTLEASRALEKAQDDPVSHVVAFKSDPEKYREYIKSH
jgi:hypothetical protein